jgi:hypothetical protein
MKKKISFVTNSSSTSFLISYKTKEPLKKLKLVIEVDMTKFFSATYEKEADVPELVRYNGYSEKTGELLLNEIKNGNVIAKLRFSSDDEALGCFIYDTCEYGGTEKIGELFKNTDVKVLDLKYEGDDED